jgi:hypothetical protein
MEGKKEDYYSVGDLVTGMKSFLYQLKKRWWLLFLIACAGAALGALYYYIQKPKYEAVCTFILEEKQSSMGGLGSIASQFGFDIGGMSGGGSIFAGDNILDILKSKKVVQQVLLSQIDSTDAKSATLSDLYLDFTGLKTKWKGRPNLETISFSGARHKLEPVQDSILNIIYDQVNKKNLVADRISKKGTIIRVQVTAQNPVFAKLLTERLVDQASRMYLSIKTGTALANIYRMQRRSDSLLALLNNKSYRAAATQLLDVNPGLKTAAVPVEIATRDKSVIATLYTEVVKNLEASKLLLSQQTPVIQLLDTPGLSMYDNKKGLAFLVIVFCFVSVMIYLAIETAGFIMKRAMK